MAIGSSATVPNFARLSHKPETSASPSECRSPSRSTFALNSAVIVTRRFTEVSLEVTGGASSCRSTTRRVARMQRRLPWGSSPLGGIHFGLQRAGFHTDATPLRVSLPRSESAATSWPCFMPHPPTGFSLQGFSRPGCRTPLDAVAPLPFKSAAVTCRPRWRTRFQSDSSKRAQPPFSRCHSVWAQHHLLRTQSRL